MLMFLKDTSNLISVILGFLSLLVVGILDFFYLDLSGYLYVAIVFSAIFIAFLIPCEVYGEKSPKNLLSTKLSESQRWFRLIAFLANWLRITIQHILFWGIFAAVLFVILYMGSLLLFNEPIDFNWLVKKSSDYAHIYENPIVNFWVAILLFILIPFAFFQAWRGEWLIRFHRAEVVILSISGQQSIREILQHAEDKPELLQIQNLCLYTNALRRKYSQPVIDLDEFLLKKHVYEKNTSNVIQRHRLSRLDLVREAIEANDDELCKSFLDNIWSHIKEIQWYLVKEEGRVVEELGSRFKAWLFPLANFRYQHTPYRSDSHLRSPYTPKFFGREKITRKLLATLRHNDTASGSYLVSGYRGAGKTSFVKKTLEDYRLGTVAPVLQGTTQHKSWWFRNYLNHLKRLCLSIAGSVALVWHKERFNYYITNQNTRLNSSLLRSLILIFQERRLLLLAFSALLALTCVLFSKPPFFAEKSNTSHIENLVIIGLPLLLVLLLVLPELRHRPWVSLLNLRWWRNLLLKPVITIHLNLGSQVLKPKEILFDIVTLLRGELKKHSGYFRLLPIFHCVIIPFFALLITVWVGDFLKLEPWVQQKVFDFQYIDEAKAKKLGCESPSSCFLIDKKQKYGKNTQHIYIPSSESNANFVQCYLKGGGLSVLAEPSDTSVNQNACLSNARTVCKVTANTGVSLSAFQTLYCASDRFLMYAFRNEEEIRTDNGTQSGGNVTDINAQEESSGNITDSNVKEALTTYAKVDNRWFYPLGWIEYYWYQLITSVSELALGQEIHTPRPLQVVLFFTFWLILSSMMYWLGRFSQRRVVKALDNIHARIAATETREFTMRSRLFGASKKQVDTPLDIRQTENLLLQALAENQSIPFFFPRPDIIFVFDELDKINAPMTREQSIEPSLDEKTPEEAIKQRKKDVEILLSQLKNLITTAACRFIFIGGRDMHDSYLGDQGSPHHLYSSIFDGVFYVESFLTDGSDERDSDVSSMVEQYVCRMLMPPVIARHIAMCLSEPEKHSDLQPSSYQPWNLRVYSAYLRYVCGRHIAESEYLQAVAFIGHLIYFLAYRSRGNPKKLGLLFEQFVWSVPKRSHADEDKRYRRVGPVFPKTRFALIVYRDDVYQIDMIANLYILLHGDTSHLIRQYGDKLTFSAFSIFDYLLKFHNMSFGPRELEYMPEVIDVHRAPALPKIIELILKRLESMYLRKLQNGLFEYRYISAFHREIEYLSQRSEENLAAFNFTLDESSEIKSHYTKLLREQSTLWGGLDKQNSKTGEGQHVHSLPALFSTLGDLHMLDHEYERALASYRNALSVLEKNVAHLSPKLNEAGKPYGNTYVPLTSSVRSLIIYIRVQLKIGLISEMRGHYDNAASIYAQTHRMVIEIASHIDLGATAIASDAEVIELLYQPRIAQSFLHAKRDHNYKSLEVLSDQAIAEYLMLWDRNIWLSNRAERKIKRSQYANWLRIKQKDSRLTYQLNIPSALKAIKELGDKLSNPFVPLVYQIRKLAPRSKAKDMFRAVIEDILYKPQIFSLTPYLQPKLISTFYLYRAQALQVRSQYFQAIGSLQMSLDLALVVKEKSDNLPYKLIADIMVNFGYSLSAVSYQHIHTVSTSGLDSIRNAMNNISKDYKDREGELCWKSIVEGDSEKLYKVLNAFKTMLEEGVEDVKGSDAKVSCQHFNGLDAVYKRIDAQVSKIKPGDSEEAIIAQWIAPGGNLDIAVHLGLLGRLAFYIAHKAYILAGEPLAAWLALWRVQYIAVYVASYWELLGVHGENSPKLYVVKDSIKSHFQAPLVSDKVNRRLEDYGHEMVDSAYRIHKMKLEKIWLADIQKNHPTSKHAVELEKKWVAPMWVKNAQVCEGFWNFYLKNHLQYIDQSAFSITNMGSYPALTRVMAEFLKGRAYLIKLQREFLLGENKVLPGMRLYKKLTQDNDVKNQREFVEYWFKSFNFLTRSLSDGIAFEGGVDLLMPPLGFAYFYLWRLLQYKSWLERPYFFMLGFDRHELRSFLGQNPKNNADWKKLKGFVNKKLYWVDVSVGENAIDPQGLPKNITKIVERLNNTCTEISSKEFDWAFFNHKEKDTVFNQIETLIKQDKEFQGDKQRYLDLTHCRARARQFLTQMVGRHRANKAYFDYVETRYYLQDDFADPNFQAGWACEYALLPIAEHMLQQLNAEDDKEEEQG